MTDELKREVERMGRRIDYLLNRADQIVDSVNGDIYGAELRTFQRWSRLIENAANLMVFYSRLVRIVNAD